MGRYISGDGAATSGASVSGATQVTVTASDAFAAGDPVFVDWKTGSINNLNGMFSAAAALTAGPATVYYTAADHATSTFAGSTAVTLADGATVLFVASRDAANNRKLIAYKYSAKGALLAKNQLATQTSSIGALIAAVLSNGNIALGYLSASASGVWLIIGPTMQIITSGVSAGASQRHIQPTSNGGFILVHSSGISFISAAGAVTDIIASTSTDLAISDEVNGDQLTHDTPACQGLINYRPAAISAGGYGYIGYNTTEAYYVAVNADGSLRSGPVTLQSGMGGLADVKYAVSSTGAIMWAASSNLGTGYYGVITDAGVTVKAATALTGIANNGSSGGYLRLVSDTAGGFVLIGGDNTSGTQAWSILCTSSAGAAVAGFPKALISGCQFPRFAIARLSTGTVCVYPAAGSYGLRYTFVNLAGTFAVHGASIYSFGGGASDEAISLLTLNDTVYGVATAGAGGAADAIIFYIVTTGALAVATCGLGISPVPTKMLRMLPDPVETGIHVVGSSATQTVVATYGLSLDQGSVYTIANVLADAHIRRYGYGLLFCDTGGTGGSSNSFVTATPANAAAFVKAKPTVLLGVAAADVAAGGQLAVNTQGTYTCLNWRTAGQNFDHSANNPAGNAGSVNNGVIHLKGL